MKSILKFAPVVFAALTFGATSTQAEELASAATTASEVKPLVRATRRTVTRQTEPTTIAPKENFAAEIEMFAGETRVIPEPNVGRLAVGNGKVLSAAVLDDKEMLLMASEVGVSAVQIWTRNGRNRRIKVTVMPSDTARVSREISAFLNAMPNTRSSVVGDKVIVEGDNLNNRTLAKIAELAKRYPQIVNFTNPGGWEKMIVMDVKVVEFPTSVLKEIGLKWATTGGVAVGAIVQPYHRGDAGPYQINIISSTSGPAPITAPGGGPVNLTSGLNVLSAINMGLNAQLNLMEQDGSAVILAQPTLSARSGSEAKFIVGGEIPYAVSTINGTIVQFKPYGIRLDVTPVVDHNGVIRAKIMSEVSDIDTAITTAFGPAIRTRKTETEFNVMNGGTIVLSGLLKRDLTDTVDKVPGVGDIPVLGALFRSKRYQNKETELVVFVTPHAVDRSTPELEQEMVKAQERLSKAPRVGTPDVAAVPLPESRPVTPGSDDDGRP